MEVRREVESCSTKVSYLPTEDPAKGEGDLRTREAGETNLRKALDDMAVCSIDV